MKDFLIYIVVSTLVLSILYMFYKYAFYKLTYFIWNRFFLLTTIILSLLLPIIKISFLNFEIPYSFNNEDDILFINNSGQVIFNISNSEGFLNEFQENKIFNIFNILFIIYLSGIIRYLYIFIKNLSYVFDVKTKSILHQSIEKIKIYRSTEKIAAFSFFNNIYVNESFFQLAEDEREQIIEHEKVHIKQFHTFDNVIVEIINIFFWFNPIIKYLKKDIKENHEFIVDNYFTKSKKTYNYSKLILKIKNNSSLAFSNSFAETQVVSRIKLMLNPEKEKIRKIRFVSSMPVLGLLIVSMIFTINVFGNSRATKKLNTENFCFPIATNYQIVSGFFRDKIIEKENDKNYKYRVSHEEITIQTASYTPVVSIGNAIVTNIDTINNWGIEEINIKIDLSGNYSAIYKGLEKSNVIINQKIKKNEIVGKTGDVRLYPTISFQLLKENVPVNPQEYLNY